MNDSGNAYKRIVSSICQAVSEFKEFIGDQFKASATNSMIERTGIVKQSIDLRRKAVRSIEQTKFAKAYYTLSSNMLAVSSRVYGTFLLTFGLYIILVYLVKHFAFSEMGEELADIVLSGAMILAALPIFIIDRSLSSLLRSSRLTGYLLTKVFGIRSAMLKPCESTGKGYVAALILGLVCGSLTIFFSPFSVLTLLVVILAVMVVLGSPEFGVTLLLFLIPFLNDNALLFAVSVVLVSLLFKVFTLKRTLHFKGIDYAVLLFCVLVFFFGVFSYRQPSGIKSAISLFTFALSYFAVSQLVTTSQMFFCCVRSFLISNLITSIITLLQFLSGVEAIPYTEYIAINFQSDYSVVMLIVVALPLLLGRIYYASSKMIATIALLIATFAIALLPPDSYWLTAVVVFFISLFVISKKGFLVVFFIAFAGIAAYNFFLSEEMRLASVEIINTVLHPFKALINSEAMLFTHSFEGVGFGNSSYIFANISNELQTVPSPISSFSYLFTSGGIITALTYVVILVTNAVNSVSACYNGTSKRLKIMVKVFSCSAIGMIIEGFSRNYFIGDRLTLFFWLIFGLIAAGNNCLEKEDTVDAYRA